MSLLHAEIFKSTISSLQPTLKWFGNNDVCVCVSKTNKREKSKKRQNVNGTKM